MDFESPLDNQAARSALVSTGIVGLTATLVQKIWGKGPRVSLPVGVATALALDYAHKRYRNHQSVRTMNDHAWNFMRRNVEKKAKSWVDRSWFEEQMTMAWVAVGGTVLAGAYAVHRNMSGVRAMVARNIPPTVVIDVLDSIGSRLPYVGRGAAAPRHVGPPDPIGFDPIKATSYLNSNLLTIGVIFASLHLLPHSNVMEFATYLSSRFIDVAIDPLIELFTGPAARPEDPHILHERVLKICENAQGAVLSMLCEEERQRDLDNAPAVPEAPSIIGVVQDNHGNRVAMTLDVDHVAEVPLVNIADEQAEQLRSQYSANVEPNEQMSLTPSEGSGLTSAEVNLVRQARIAVMTTPVSGALGGRTLRQVVQETIDDTIVHESHSYPENMNSATVVAVPHQTITDRRLSNGRTIRQMVMDGIMADSDPLDPPLDPSNPLIPDDPDMVLANMSPAESVASTLSGDGEDAPILPAGGDPVVEDDWD